MNYIVFDLEWNQSPSGKEDSVDHLPFEIIEIGAVRLDREFCRTGTFHQLIRPQVYKKLHFKISEVTHMDMKKLYQEGRPFEDVMKEFMKWWGEEEYCFCTWGSMDLTELQRNMVYYGLLPLFPRPFLYYDIQKLFCFQYGDGRNRVSLDQAVQQMGMAEERPFHRALDDAYYTGKILSVLDMEHYGVYESVDYYGLPRNREEEYILHFPEYTKLVSREFESREEIMKDKYITDMECLKCKRMLRKKIRWFPYGQRFYFCLAACPEHGYMKGKIRVKKSEQDKYYIVKTVKLAGEEDVELLMQRREDGRRKRNAKGHSRIERNM